MNPVKKVYVMTCCQYFCAGMKALICLPETELCFINEISEIEMCDDAPLVVLLVLDMSGSQSLKNFKIAVDCLNQINSPKKIGVLVSKYNSYLTYYFKKKFHGKVTFFNSHNMHTGLFQQNFISWLNGKTFRPMHVVQRFRDNRYGFSLKEWISLVIPLSGETIQEMSACMKIPAHTLYQTRTNAIKKIGLSSYRQFCELYINGKLRTENDRIVRK